MSTLTADEIKLGTRLPELVIVLTPTLIVSTAIATRDFTPVHHDPEMARSQGSKDIFLNILTTMGLVERYVTDWAGPDARLCGLNVKLGVPAYAGDTLTFNGWVGAQVNDEISVHVRGTVSLGDHAIGMVQLAFPF